MLATQKDAPFNCSGNSPGRYVCCQVGCEAPSIICGGEECMCMPTHSNHQREDIVLVQKRLQFSEAASAESLVRSLIISLEGLKKNISKYLQKPGFGSS